jgi:hypothetical protein
VAIHTNSTAPMPLGAVPPSMFPRWLCWACCCGDIMVKSVVVRASGTVNTPGRSTADIVKVGGGRRSLHSPLFSISIPYGMGGFHPHSMEFHGLFFGWQPSHLFIPYPLWKPYGMSMEWCIPYGFHGLVHVDAMEFPMNLQFINCNSMYYSIRIPWKSPYGFHVTVHLKFCGKTPSKCCKK